MGKRRKILSHTEIWDDSALLQSWNDALTEYELYHSIHVRGERVEDVWRAAEAGKGLTNGEPSISAANPASAESTRAGDTDAYDLEDGELMESQDENGEFADPDVSSNTQPNPGPHIHEPHEKSQDQGNLGVPQALLTNVHDKSLQKLMMAWYYAGYYTGLYQGQQQAHMATDSRGRNEGG